MDILPILSTLRRHKVTAFLVILEIALTCAIVCNAVFLIIQRVDRIHMPSGVAEHELVQIQLADTGAKSDDYARAQEDLAALRQIPGVTQVASVRQVPFGMSSNNAGIRLDPDQNKPTLDATTETGEKKVAENCMARPKKERAWTITGSVCSRPRPWSASMRRAISRIVAGSIRLSASRISA